MQSQHKVGQSSSNDFGMSSSHVVCRNDYACSSSGFEAFSTALTVMGTLLRLCLVRICGLIRVLWSGPHSGASAQLIGCLFSAQEPSNHSVCFVSQHPYPPHPWRRGKVSFSAPVPGLLPLSIPLTLPCNAEMSGKEGAGRVVAGGAGDRGKSHLEVR